jgi:hypothetical protein
VPSSKDASTQGANTAGAAQKKGDATSPGGTIKKQRTNTMEAGHSAAIRAPFFLVEKFGYRLARPARWVLAQFQGSKALEPRQRSAIASVWRSDAKASTF